MLGLAGCHSVASMDSPSMPGARSAVVIVRDETAVIGVHAVDLEGGGVWPEVSARAPATIEVLGFSCTLSRLGLEPGWQAVLDAPAEADRLPPPAVIFSAAITDEGASAWERAPALDQGSNRALRSLPLPGDTLCKAVGARFEPRPLMLAPDLRDVPAFFVEVDETRCLVGTAADLDEGRPANLYLVELSGQVTRLAPLESRAHLAGYRARDGELWMVASDGALVRGSIEAGFGLVGTSTIFVGADLASLAGPAGGAAFELFAAVLRAGFVTFARFDGTRWTVLSSGGTRERHVPNVVWLGPEEAVAIGAGSEDNSVVRFDHGRVTRELVRGASGLTGMFHHPDLGTVVGTLSEGLYRFDGTGWEPMAGAPPLLFIRAFSREGPGFLYDGAEQLNFTSSAFFQYHPSIGFCQNAEHYTDASARYLARFGDRALLALTMLDDDAPMGLTILDRTQEARSCSDLEE